MNFIKTRVSASILSATFALLSATSHAKNEGVTFTPTTETFDFVRESFPFGGEGLAGAAWFDYNNDGHIDVYLTNGKTQKNALYKNKGDMEFIDVTDYAGVGNMLGNSGVVAADLNNDGFEDLFLTGEGGSMAGVDQSPTILYKNNGDGTFTQIDTTAAGIPGPKSAMMSAMGDIDNDGDLDIFVTAPSSLYTPEEYHISALYRNDGDFQFTDITEEANVIARKAPCVTGFSDYDNDNDVDLFVGNCNDPVFGAQPIQLFRNDGNLNFTDVTEEAGLAQVPGFWMTLSFADIDNDGDIDVFSGSAGNSMPMYMPHALLLNNGDGTFSDVASDMGIADQRFSWGSSIADFDNDGFNDLFFTGSLPLPPFFNAIGPFGNSGLLFMNEQTSKNHVLSFEPSHENLGIDTSSHYTSGVATADVNNDGFSDFLVMTEKWLDHNTGIATDGKPILYMNDGTRNRSTTIKLKGTSSNTSAVGARVELVTAKTRQTKEVYAGSSFLSTDSKNLTFGLKRSRHILKLEIRWPSGCNEEYLGLRAQPFIELTEGEPMEKWNYSSYRRNYAFYISDNCHD